MSVLTLSGIAGSVDGQKPIYQPDDRWTTWSINEIFTGQIGKNRYVPKIDDYVIDPATNYYRRVVSIDPTTMIPTLVPITTVDEGELNEMEVMLGVGPSAGSEARRVYIDKSVMPFTMAVDGRVTVPNADAVMARVYRGSKLTGTFKVISSFFDNSGNLLGQDIPLTLAAVNEIDNHTIKTVPTCYTTEDVKDGDILTLVAFSDAGHVVYQRQLMAENTGFIRGKDLGTKYVKAITLKSAFLSKSDPKLIQYPINVPTVGLDLVGVVHYSDGTTMELPVDGTRFQAFGWQGYVATIVGQPFSMVLRYNLAPGEVAYGETVGGGFLTTIYKVVTTPVEGAYSVKLYGYPVWVDTQNGYRMEWFLYNLDRNVMYNVTPYVKPSGAGAVFNPTAYGVHQQLSVAVDLAQVNGSYKSYKHVQIIDVVLVAPGTTQSTNWMIGFNPGQDPMYGVGVAAKTTFINQNLTKVKVDCGAADLASWLDMLYYRGMPLVDSSKELQAPQPTFFQIEVNGVVTEFPISYWNQELVIYQPVQNASTLFVKFCYRLPTNELQLGIAGLPVYQQN